MAELENWLDEVIFEPIENAIATGEMKELHRTFSECKQLLKRKVLASYHNGLKAKQTSNPKNNGQLILPPKLKSEAFRHSTHRRAEQTR